MKYINYANTKALRDGGEQFKLIEKKYFHDDFINYEDTLDDAIKNLPDLIRIVSDDGGPVKVRIYSIIDNCSTYDEAYKLISAIIKSGAEVQLITEGITYPRETPNFHGNEYNKLKRIYNSLEKYTHDGLNFNPSESDELIAPLPKATPPKKKPTRTLLNPHMRELDETIRREFIDYSISQVMHGKVYTWEVRGVDKDYRFIYGSKKLPGISGYVDYYILEKYWPKNKRGVGDALFMLNMSYGDRVSMYLA